MRNRPLITVISPWTLFLRSSLLCGLLGSILFALSLQRIEPFPLNLERPQFDGAQAYHQMYTLSKSFPNRVTWGESRVRAAGWIKDEFKKLGYTPKSLQFSEVIAGKQYNQLENIYVEKVGTKHPNEILVAMAHYDITDTTTEGAMDDGSGIGVVLELARIFAKAPSDRTMIFMATDSEEFGAFWGARAFARSYERADDIVAALNFDFISPGKQTRILTLCDGLKNGFTPLWFREIALDSIRSFGKVEAKDMDGVEEFIERAMQIPPADHGAFLAAGIPAVNWVGQPENFAYVMSHYHHTKADVAEALEPEAFQIMGEAAERTLRSIDQLPRIPQNPRDSNYFKISKQYYLPGWSSTVIQILLFLPFFFFGFLKTVQAVKTQAPHHVLAVIRNELKNIVLLLSSMLFGYGIMVMLPALKIIAQYETHPATQKSLILYTPNVLLVLVVIATVVCVYAFFRHVFYEPKDASNHPRLRHSVHTALLVLIIVLAFFKNSYLGTLLLLPPAYFWTAINTKRHGGGRILNLVLILSGAVTFIAIATVMNMVFHVGVFYWYLFLSASYGLISAYAVVLFLMSITLMIRLTRSFVL